MAVALQVRVDREQAAGEQHYRGFGETIDQAALLLPVSTHKGDPAGERTCTVRIDVLPRPLEDYVETDDIPADELLVEFEEREPDEEPLFRVLYTDGANLRIVFFSDFEIQSLSGWSGTST